jgi:hypothetical protein
LRGGREGGEKDSKHDEGTKAHDLARW